MFQIQAVVWRLSRRVARSEPDGQRARTEMLVSLRVLGDGIVALVGWGRGGSTC